MSGSDARRRPRTLNARPLAEATDRLETYREYWDASFARLDGLLRELKCKKTKRKCAAPRREITPLERIVASEKFDDASYPGEALDPTVFVEARGITSSSITILIGPTGPWFAHHLKIRPESFVFDIASRCRRQSRP